MVYEFELIVPANTLKTSPATQDILLVPGILTLVEAEFPPGCHRQVNVVIRQGAYQMFPRNPDGTLRADDHVISFNPHQELKRNLHELTAEGWSPATLYEHKIGLRFNVQPAEIATPWEILRDFVAIFKRLVGID